MFPLLFWNFVTITDTFLERPNIIFLLADDLGWNDVGWNNPNIHTPMLDQLARGGIVLNNSYVSPLCSPSRSALLTGYYPFTIGMQHGVLKKTKPQGIPLNITLLPQRLRQLGYTTHMVGKWHLGFCKWDYTPTYRGFDSFVGFYLGGQDYYDHMSEDGYDFRYNTKVYYPKEKYSPFLYSERVVDVINNRPEDKPFFIYMSFQSVHIPLIVPKNYEYQYLHVRDRRRRVYSGMVSAMDDAVRDIYKALERNNLLNNTIIAFTSDNGGAPLQGGNNWPLRGGKGTVYEGGTRTPAFIWGQMLNRTGYVSNELFHVTDWVPTLIEAAGGQTEPELDGLSQWQALNNQEPSPRSEFVYAYNEINGRSAIRYKQWKLIQGHPGHYTDWYPTPDHPEYRSRRNKDRRRSHERHRNVTVLYDIEADPSEREDVSAQYPDKVALLQDILSNYSERLVPSQNPRKERLALPMYHGGVWSPGWC